MKTVYHDQKPLSIGVPPVDRDSKSEDPGRCLQTGVRARNMCARQIGPGGPNAGRTQEKPSVHPTPTNQRRETERTQHTGQGDRSTQATTRSPAPARTTQPDRANEQQRDAGSDVRRRAQRAGDTTRRARNPHDTTEPGTRQGRTPDAPTRQERGRTPRYQNETTAKRTTKKDAPENRRRKRRACGPLTEPGTRGTRGRPSAPSDGGNITQP